MSTCNGILVESCFEGYEFRAVSSHEVPKIRVQAYASMLIPPKRQKPTTTSMDLGGHCKILNG